MSLLCGMSDEPPRNHGCHGRQVNMAASSVEGPLSKWTNVMKGWQYRWFVLDDNAGLLSYYTRLWDQTGIVAPTQHNFDTKLTEADSYLQLLIEQIRDLEYSIEKVADPRERQQLSGIGSNANALLETVKHTIVLLQIAKNTAQPVNGVYPQLRGTEDRPAPLRTRDDAASTAGVQALEAPRALSAAGRESGGSDSKVPPVSYSSDDEDEEFFFDTQEETEHVPPIPSHFMPQPLAEARTTEATADKSATDVMNSASSSQAAAPLYSVYDAAYEDDAEDELGSLEGQKSVFSHLLSQVRIGMDLTKVTLPTFILERRSLLEMYADFFAHPDIFVSIVDRDDPKERMVEVVRWYLSAFHAGRKSSVAKKPYNPILGEIFRCYWRIGDKPGAPIKDGPVPWATTNDLTFIAEQVSHHPPVSAFYAEHAAKGIACCAHIWTKSKYLGMSIGVHNVGQGCIMFLRHDEEYVVSFPSGYGRSIFTVPWIELGGTVEITCQKTGYNAVIQFHTKPMIGGKKHQLTAEVFPPNERKPFMTVTGEWNGVMTAKYPNGDQAVFVDTTTLATTKKVVQPIQQQEAFESRRLWKEVTLALKNKDVNKATSSKTFLEEQQRREASERLHSGQTWKTRVFHMEGEHWAYDHSLQKRMGKKN
ncbi:oxysterol-binding protein-related protein 9-like isoform X2 [Amblyomma americanum]